MKLRIVGPIIQRGKIKLSSDTYFNNPSKVEDLETFSDVVPVDAFGGFVPQDKSLANLKKAEAENQDRFNLSVDKGGEA